MSVQVPSATPPSRWKRSDLPPTPTYRRNEFYESQTFSAYVLAQPNGDRGKPTRPTLTSFPPKGLHTHGGINAGLGPLVPMGLPVPRQGERRALLNRAETILRNSFAARLGGRCFGQTATISRFGLGDWSGR